MALFANFSTYIPSDNQDILVDDLEFLINNIHAEISDRTDAVDANWSGAGWTGTKQPRGIIYGMDLSYNAGTDEIEVSEGQGYVNGSKVVLAGSETIAVAGTPVIANDYIVARLVITDGSPRTNPITGVNENMEKVFSTTLVSTAAPVATTDVILGRVIAFSGAEPLFGSVASYAFNDGGNAITFYPVDGAATDVRGAEGNKHFIRFEVSPASALSVTETDDQSGMGFKYLNVVLKGSPAGANISTLTEIINAINATSTYFRASLTGGLGTFVSLTLTTTLANFTPLSGGDSYATFYQVVTGSGALQKVDRFNIGDPFTKHISQKGAGLPTENNPHGTTLADMGVTGLDIEDHIEREHYLYATIPRNASASFLGTTISNQDCIIGSGGASDSCIIQGKVHTLSAGYTVTNPSSSFSLYEFYVNNTGILSSRVVATYDASTVVPTYASIQNGDHVVLNIIDKDKYLSGTKVLRLNVVGGVYTAYFGASTGTVVTAASGPYRLVDPTDLTWIDVYCENEALADDDYRNTVTFTAFDDKTELPVSVVSWKGDQDEWGYAGVSELWVDKRSYGTMDMVNEKHLTTAERSPVKFTTLDEGGFLYYGVGTLNLNVKQFEIEFRGTKYRNEAIQTIALTDNTYSFLIASFNERNVMTLSIEEGITTPTIGDRDSVILGVIRTVGGAITFAYGICISGDYSRSREYTNFDIATEDDFWNAMHTLKALNVLSANYRPNVILNFRNNVDIDSNNVKRPTSFDISYVTIKGNGYKVSYTGTGGYIETVNNLYIYDLKLSYDETMFLCDGTNLYCTGCTIARTGGTDPFCIQTDDDIFFENCYIQGVLRAESSGSMYYLSNCVLDITLTGDGGIKATNCTFAGQDQAELFQRGLTFDESVFTNCKLISCTWSDLGTGTYKMIGCELTGTTITGGGALTLDLSSCTTTTSSFTDVAKMTVTNCTMSHNFGTDVISHGNTGILFVTNSTISRLRFSDPDSEVRIANSEITETIVLNGVSNIFLEGVTYNYDVNDRALFTHVTADVYIQASGIHLVTANSLGFITGTAIAGSHKVYLNLSNSTVLSFVHLTATLTRLTLQINMTDCFWANFAYIFPAATTTVINVIGSTLIEAFFDISGNISPDELLINFTNCDLSWTAIVAGGSRVSARISYLNCVLAAATGFFAGDPGGSIIVLMDNCNTDANLDWEFDWGLATVEIHFKNMTIPENLVINTVDVGRWLIYATNCYFYKNSWILGGAPAAECELRISNSTIYQTALTYMFTLNDMDTQSSIFRITDCVVNAKCLLICNSNAVRSAQYMFSGVTGNLGIVNANAAGAANASNFFITSCVLEETANPMQLLGYTYLKVTNSRIVADSPFVYFIRAYIDSTYMATTTLNGEIFTANASSLFLKVSNSYFYLASTSNLIYGDATIIFEADSTIISNKNEGALVIEKANPVTTNTISIKANTCVFSNNILQQDAGTFDVNISNSEFSEAFVQAKCTGTLITATINIHGCVWEIETGANPFYYGVALWFDGTNDHDMKVDINISDCKGDFYALSAASYGSGLLGIHSDITPTVQFLSGNIVMKGNTLYAYTEVDLGYRTIAILRQSVSANNPSLFCGSVLLSDNDVFSDSDSATDAFCCGTIFRGATVVNSLFTLYTKTGRVDEQSILVKVVNCHQIGGPDSFCSATVFIDDVTYRVTMIYDNISHTSIYASRTFDVRATNTGDYSIVCARNIINATTCYLEIGDAGSIQVAGCVETVFTGVSFGSAALVNISNCSHSACAAHFITVSTGGTTALLKVSDLVIFFTGVGYYLLYAAAAETVVGGILSDTLQKSGHASFTTNVAPMTLSNNVHIL